MKMAYFYWRTIFRENARERFLYDALCFKQVIYFGILYLLKMNAFLQVIVPTKEGWRDQACSRILLLVSELWCLKSIPDF